MNIIYVYCSIIFFFLWALATKMFEYSLWVWFGKDVPWYLDLIGALAINGAIFFVWVISLIASYCHSTPIF